MEKLKLLFSLIDDELADAMKAELSAKWTEYRGIEVQVVGVSSIKAEEEDEKMLKDLQKNAAFRDPTLAAANLVGAQADAMRKKLREANVDYTVYKNTLVKRAIDGTKYEALAEVLEGPSAFAFSYDDATAPARVLSEAIKEFKKMEFKGGLVEGEYYDSSWKKRRQKYSGWTAQIIQHECDHLEGIII